MKKILVLGAGLVAKPLVRYLLDLEETEVTVASRTVSKAEALIDNHPRGKALPLLVDDTGELEKLVAGSDLAISLVPYAYHVSVAKLCLEHGLSLVTTSYVSEEMMALDGEAKEKGLLLLNECGLDPGIDHMSAMKIIHEVEAKGGKVTSFRSCCGGLPAPEANDNPLGYKFSWSPHGVLLAGRNAAKWLEDGEIMDVPGPELFTAHWPVTVDGMELEFYPNRDCTGYIEIYGLKDAATVFRGTFRNRGWCRALKRIADLGLLDEAPRDDLAGISFKTMTARLLGVDPAGEVRAAFIDKLGLADEPDTVERLEWLGLLSDETVPEAASVLDVLEKRMLELMSYNEGERDMIVLHHDFVAEYPGGKKEQVTSTLVDFGIPNGDSSMSRTVSLPAAMATKLILEGKITDTGVKIPVDKGIYEPVLEELKTVDLEFTEKSEAI